MLEFIDLKAINSLLTEISETEIKMQSVYDDFKQIKDPVAPFVIEDPEEWDDYVDECRGTDDLKAKLSTQWETYKNYLNAAKVSIKSKIPANTWVKVSGNRYIAYKTDDWPGYVPELLIRGSEEELPLL